MVEHMVEQKEWLVIDLGGSIVAPVNSAGPDADFAVQLLNFLQRWLIADERRYLALVIGGGAPARRYQQGAATVRETLRGQGWQLSECGDEAVDWLGIRATHLNGEYLRLLACGLTDREGEAWVRQPLLMSYDQLPPTSELGRIVVGGGWKPGFSTDYVSVLLAEHVGAQRLLCLSNIAQIYADDPAKNPSAPALTEIDWQGYQKMVGTEWIPGRSMPFDPVATAHAAKIGMELVFADGRDWANLQNILNGAAFIGTVVR